MVQSQTKVAPCTKALFNNGNSLFFYAATCGGEGVIPVPTKAQLEQAAKKRPKDRSPQESSWVTEAIRGGNTAISNLDYASRENQRING